MESDGRLMDVPYIGNQNKHDIGIVSYCIHMFFSCSVSQDEVRQDHKGQMRSRKDRPWSSLLQSFFESSSDLEEFILKEGGLSEIARLLPRLCERLKDAKPCEDNRHVTLALQVLDPLCGN